MLQIVVFGTGAVGGYFGGRLAQAGEDIVFVARGNHLQAILNEGLRVTSINGDFVVRPAQATDDPSCVGPADVILLAVKAWQVPEAAEALRPMIGAATVIVPLQNGVEAPTQLVEVIGAEHVVGGMCRIFADITAPGHVRHTGVQPYIAFGELDGRPSERTQRLLDVFARTVGVTAEVPADIRIAMWRKFLFVASWSGLGALTRAPIGVMRNRPETRQMLQQALREIHAVAVAHQVPLADEAIDETLAFIDSLPPDSLASLQRDVLDGKPSELAFQSGAVVRLGRASGVEVPVHTFIYQSLVPLELRARGEIQFTV